MLLHRYTLAGYFGFAVHVSATCGMRCPGRTMNRQVLHQAESATVGGYELSQQCRSYRYAAEILDLESDLTTPLLHTYWGMGLPMQHSQVAARVICFDNYERSRRVIANILELTGVTPRSLDYFQRRRPKKFTQIGSGCSILNTHKIGPEPSTNGVDNKFLGSPSMALQMGFSARI